MTDPELLERGYVDWPQPNNPEVSDPNGWTDRYLGWLLLFAVPGGLVVWTLLRWLFG